MCLAPENMPFVLHVAFRLIDSLGDIFEKCGLHGNTLNVYKIICQKVWLRMNLGHSLQRWSEFTPIKEKSCDQLPYSLLDKNCSGACSLSGAAIIIWVRTSGNRSSSWLWGVGLLQWSHLYSLFKCCKCWVFLNTGVLFFLQVICIPHNSPEM